MNQYILKDDLVAKIKNLENTYKTCPTRNSYEEGLKNGRLIGYKDALHEIDTLEVKEVDLDKLGEIARHLIAVKENIEDMRLDSREWNLLKRIGYPERFKAQK